MQRLCSHRPFAGTARIVAVVRYTTRIGSEHQQGLTESDNRDLLRSQNCPLSKFSRLTSISRSVYKLTAGSVLKCSSACIVGKPKAERSVWAETISVFIRDVGSPIEISIRRTLRWAHCIGAHESECLALDVIKLGICVSFSIRPCCGAPIIILGQRLLGHDM